VARNEACELRAGLHLAGKVCKRRGRHAEEGEALRRVGLRHKGVLLQ